MDEPSGLTPSSWVSKNELLVYALPGAYGLLVAAAYFSANTFFEALLVGDLALPFYWQAGLVEIVVFIVLSFLAGHLIQALAPVYYQWRMRRRNQLRFEEQFFSFDSPLTFTSRNRLIDFLDTAYGVTIRSGEIVNGSRTHKARAREGFVILRALVRSKGMNSDGDLFSAYASMHAGLALVSLFASALLPLVFFAMYAPAVDGVHTVHGAFTTVVVVVIALVFWIVFYGLYKAFGGRFEDLQGRYVQSTLISALVSIQK